MNVEQDAKTLDEEDAFKPLTNLFDMPMNKQGKPLIYLNGNSLGPKLKRMDECLLNQCRRWGQLGVRGHFDGESPWVTYHQQVTQSLARLVGAHAQEVVAMGTLTGNLHLALISFYQPTPTRYKVIRFDGFPSDTYAMTSQIRQRLETIQAFNAHAFDPEEAVIELKPDESGYISSEVIEDALKTHGDETALVWFEAVHYLTGQAFDIRKITALAHQYGCLVGFDLAHAIGNIPLNLHADDVDFAVWCSYKYLSAGPGAVAGLYIHERHASDPKRLRLTGWWGNKTESRFAMAGEFDPFLSAEGWQLSSVGVFAMAMLQEALCVFDAVNLHELYAKNKRLVTYLEYLLHKECSETIQIITPERVEERGCQLSLRFKQSQDLSHFEHLFLAHDVVCDVRAGVIRVAPMGLYNRFQDVFDFVTVLKKWC